MITNEWVVDVANVLVPANLARIAVALEQDYIIVEHLHYAGGSSKDTLLFGSFEEFMEHLTTKTKPGDLFYILCAPRVVRPQVVPPTGEIP